MADDNKIALYRRAATWLVVLAAIFGLAALASERTFFADVQPVADNETPSLWPMTAAYVLRSIEYLALTVGGLSLIVVIGIRWFGRMVK
jgi:hypothetical protein